MLAKHINGAMRSGQLYASLPFHPLPVPVFSFRFTCHIVFFCRFQVKTKNAKQNIWFFLFCCEKMGFFWFKTKTEVKWCENLFWKPNQKFEAKASDFFRLKLKKCYFSFCIDAKVSLSKRKTNVMPKEAKIGQFFSLEHFNWKRNGSHFASKRKSF
jgi:hypothetical protein